MGGRKRPTTITLVTPSFSDEGHLVCITASFSLQNHPVCFLFPFGHTAVQVLSAGDPAAQLGPRSIHFIQTQSAVNTPGVYENVFIISQKRTEIQILLKSYILCQIIMVIVIMITKYHQSR